MMFPYDLPFLPGSGPPERWDVVVFRYPEEPEVSYIKRLVGLPGETIRIFHGDVYVKTAGERRPSPWPASRCGTRPRCRSPSTTIAISLGPWSDKPEWQRWRRRRGPAGSWSIRVRAATRPNGSSTDAVGRAAVSQSRARPRAVGGRCGLNEPCRAPPAPTLITDFYSYNTNMSAESYKPARR